VPRKITQIKIVVGELGVNKFLTTQKYEEIIEIKFLHFRPDYEVEVFAVVYTTWKTEEN